MPVPGTDAGPWLVGTAEEMKVWPDLFNASRESVYRARKGVTTDVNGIFFVTAQQVLDEKMVRIANDPRNGRRRDVAATSAVVEKDDVFPLLRGRDVHRFVATPQSGQCVIVPQRGMFGDEDLPASRPRMFRFLSQFRTILERRSSYRRFQQGKPFWSIWSTGEYTFSPYKVVWREMSGGGFVAAYVDYSEFCGGTKMVIPDHKVYFVPVSSEDEAAYLTAFLNASMVSDAINAYSSALSLGTSVTDYLNIPGFDEHNETMMLMVSMAKRFKHGDAPTKEDETTLNSMVRKLIK